MLFRYVHSDVSAGDKVFLFGEITITCPMLLLNQLPIKVQSEKVSFSVARQLFKQLWLLTPGNARPFVPTETQSWLLPKRRGKEWPWDMVQSKKRHSHHSSAGALACFFSLFYPFLRERVVLFEKESLEREKCAFLIVCREWGVQEGKMEFAVMGRAVVTRQQSGLLVLQYTWCLSQHCCKIIHVYVK